MAARYRDGFSECAQEVDRFLASVSGLGHDTRYRLMNHLATCIKQPPLPARRTHIHPPATFSAPALNPGIYDVPLPPTSAASLTTGRVDFTSGCSESTVDDVVTPSLDARRRSLSVASAPYRSAVFPGFVATAPTMNGRLSAGPLFPVRVDDDEQSAAILSGESTSFRPIQPASIVDRCSSVDSDELDAEMTRCDAASDVDDAANSQSRGPASASRDVVGGRPLTEKNDNTDNIARGFLDAQKREAQGPDATAAVASAADQSMMVLMMAMHDDVKDEHVWRPW